MFCPHKNRYFLDPVLFPSIVYKDLWRLFLIKPSWCWGQGVGPINIFYEMVDILGRWLISWGDGWYLGEMVDILWSYSNDILKICNMKNGFSQHFLIRRKLAKWSRFFVLKVIIIIQPIFRNQLLFPQIYAILCHHYGRFLVKET